ncbi:hypothetical protein [Crateriforma conspicua]|uniref:Uncharacterized protein n=1 Tax=Crateriforma conspicua TaxID=2527996 RepID=A0A5C5Y8D0_9PLAN|nr:hypothetical protein [Crateriforma conspicua]TWT71926.1 hypothetical protein Pan14r_42430 [Crateriforma conspicua]
MTRSDPLRPAENGARETLRQTIDRLGPPPPAVAQRWVRDLADRDRSDPVFAIHPPGKDAWDHLAIRRDGRLSVSADLDGPADTQRPIDAADSGLWLQKLAESLGVADSAGDATPISTAGSAERLSADTKPADVAFPTDDDASDASDENSAGTDDALPWTFAQSGDVTTPTTDVTDSESPGKRRKSSAGKWGAAAAATLVIAGVGYVATRPASPTSDSQTQPADARASTNAIDSTDPGPEPQESMELVESFDEPADVPRTLDSADLPGDDDDLTGQLLAGGPIPGLDLTPPALSSTPTAEGDDTATPPDPADTMGLNDPLLTGPNLSSSGDVLPDPGNMGQTMGESVADPTALPPDWDEESGVDDGDEMPQDSADDLPVAATGGDAEPVDPIAVVLDSTDQTHAFDISTADLDRETTLEIQVRTPDSVSPHWVMPIADASPRRCRGVVALFPSDAEVLPAAGFGFPVLAVRLDVRTGSKMSVRTRYAVRLGPMTPWLEVTTGQMEAYAATVASQAVQLDRFLAQIDRIEMSSLSGSQRAEIRQRRDTVKQASQRISDLGDRVAKLVTLVHDVAAEAKIDVRVTGSQGEILTTQ